MKRHSAQRPVDEVYITISQIDQAINNALLCDSRLARAIKIAQLRCLSTEELLTEIDQRWRHEAVGDHLSRIEERADSLKDDELHAIFDSATRIALDSEHISSALKNRADGILKRTLRLCKPEAVRSLAQTLLYHLRKGRRKVGFQILKELGIAKSDFNQLLQQYSTTRDAYLLYPIAANAGELDEDKSDWLLESLDSDYWRSRAIQELTKTRGDAALTAIASKHLTATIWAAGRSQDGRLATIAANVMQRSGYPDHNLEFFAWMLGKLRWRAELAVLAEIVDTRVPNVQVH